MAKQHSYENDKIRVSFDGNICAHAGFCFTQLHDVFDGDRDPPIDLTGGTTEEVIRVVEGCPSSALVYERLDGADNEVPDETATATLYPNAPLVLKGKLQLGDKQYARLTLCRCGKSSNKPFCDGAHKAAEWDDGANTSTEDLSGEARKGDLTLVPIENGPVRFKGYLMVQSADGEKICERESGALCRCGASKIKPFCDGSHREIDFKA